MKKLLLIMFSVISLSMIAAEKTPAELIAEKQKELTAAAEKSTEADIAPAQKLAAEKLAAFQGELNARLEQDADTLTKRQIVPNNNKMRDFQTKVNAEIDERVSQTKKQLGGGSNVNKSILTDMKKRLQVERQKDIEAYKKQIESDTADLISRFKKMRDEKNQEKLGDYAKKLEEITASGKKIFSDYHSAVAASEFAQYEAQITGKAAPEEKALVKPQFTPAFPAAVDPDKKFIYQNFR